MSRLASRIVLLMSLVALSLSFVACGPPTLESQVARYKAVLTKLDVLAAKQPQFRDAIEKKKFEAATEFQNATALTGEEGARAVARVASNLETFEAGLNPQAPATNRPAGSKLNGGQGVVGQPQPGTQPAPTGGKLGGTATPPPAGGTNTGGSGFGTPTGNPTPAPTPAPAPNGNSGFGTPTGNPTPAPTPTPAPAPAPQGGSGFGGK